MYTEIVLELVDTLTISGKTLQNSNQTRAWSVENIWCNSSGKRVPHMQKGLMDQEHHKITILDPLQHISATCTAVQSQFWLTTCCLNTKAVWSRHIHIALLRHWLAKSLSRSSAHVMLPLRPSVWRHLEAAPCANPSMLMWTTKLHRLAYLSSRAHCSKGSRGDWLALRKLQHHEQIIQTSCSSTFWPGWFVKVGMRKSHSFHSLWQDTTNTEAITLECSCWKMQMQLRFG